ncbi:MAG: glutathione S-transferase family protein [Hyphomicrobiaceae bacterium]|nr:glutathione S-transferase family protein [Hyphomicrobiaceae bacterium]
MYSLTHFRLCPHSRSIRVALGELETEVELVEEFPWEWREAFLALNPAGELPVLQTGASVVCGAYAISEFLADERAGEETPREDGPLFPGNPAKRAEVRRLVDWFHGKMNREVTRELLAEKVYSRMRPDVPQAPDTGVLRAIRANLRYHMSYLTHLADQHGWLAGDDLSFADMAAAAHLSCADYLGEVPWDDFPSVRTWYSRIKSRKAFRPILTDRLPGLPPPLIYTDLDF